MIYLLVGTLVSFIVSQGLSMSIYDVMMDMKGLPYLPALRSSELYVLHARDLMTTDYNFLTFDSNLRDVGKVIQRSIKQFLRVPIIDQDHNL